jgi:hypothetical protein
MSKRVVRTIAVPETLLRELVTWLEGARNCETWQWDADQHAAAGQTLEDAARLLDYKVIETEIPTNTQQVAVFCFQNHPDPFYPPIEVNKL